MNKPFFTNNLVWKPDEKYTNHRIPGMLVTDKGTLLIVCEARTALSDWALMDIILQRSEDGGESFGEPIVMAVGTAEHKTVNNPVLLQDVNGRLHFLYCEDYGIRGGRMYRRYSDDDGVSWSEKIDITSATLPDYRNAFAFGPGHGIRTGDGTLLVPVWAVPKHYEAKLDAHMPSVISTFYSKDNGESWQTGDILYTNSDVICPNETEAALTSDGRVYLSIRHLSMQRSKAYSATGYSDWTDYSPEYALNDPQCFGAVVAYNDGVNPYTLLCANCDSKVKRGNVTVRGSVDDGKTWTLKAVIDPDLGGYVECAVDEKNGFIYVMYEKNYGETVHLAKFNYEWLIGEKTDE